MDAERERIAETRNLHAELWRTLVSLEHDQHDIAVLNLPSIVARQQQEREAVSDYLAHQEVLVRDPEQRQRLQELKAAVGTWLARWNAAVTSGSSASELLTDAEQDFEPIEKLLSDFDHRELQLWQDALRFMSQRRELFFGIVASIAT